jgi:hypothetical protein
VARHRHATLRLSVLRHGSGEQGHSVHDLMKIP